MRDKKKKAAYMKIYNANHKERVAAYKAAWVVANKEKRTKSLQQYNNSDKGKVTQRKYRRTPKGKKLSRRAKIKCEYSMTEQYYDELCQRQGGKCAICGRHRSEFKRRLFIDHDHETGKVRGLLCMMCNTAIGLMKDDISRLLVAAMYLEENRCLSV
jgi:hypothetical protein